MVAPRTYQVKKGSRLAFEVIAAFEDDNNPSGQNPSFSQDSPISSDLKCEAEEHENAAIPIINSDTKDRKVEDGNRTGLNTGVEDATHYGRQIPYSRFYDPRQRRPGLATTTHWPRENLDAPRKPADDLIDYNAERQFSTFTQFWCIVAVHGSTSTWGNPTGEFNMRHNGQDLWRCRTCMYKKSELWFVKDVPRCPRCTFPTVQLSNSSSASRSLGMIIYREGVGENTD